MSERVLEAVLGRVPVWTAGEISGFKRSALANDRCYPGVCRAPPSSTVRGRVLHDITAEELTTMDRFEGEEYEAVVMPDVRLESGKDVRARVWVLSNMEGVLDSEWSFDEFVEKNEGWYVRMCKEWADEDAIEQKQFTSQQRGGD